MLLRIADGIAKWKPVADWSDEAKIIYETSRDELEKQIRLWSANVTNQMPPKKLDTDKEQE